MEASVQGLDIIADLGHSPHDRRWDRIQDARTIRTRLLILMMVSGFVLLIVCANVANLMLVRGMERRRQTSLSLALGREPRES